MQKLRRPYLRAGPEYQRQLLDQAPALLGYHRKAAIRALRAPPVARGPRIVTGRPRRNEPSVLLPWLRPIWPATDYACGRRLVAMLPEWIPDYEQQERRRPGEVREKLLAASGRTLDRPLEPLRGRGAGRRLTRPGTLLRHQIPVRGRVGRKARRGGWRWIRWRWAGAAWRASLFGWWTPSITPPPEWRCGRCGAEVRPGPWPPCAIGKPACPLRGWAWPVNGGEFLNYHVNWLPQRPRPVFVTRSRPYKKDDTAHLEQRNWTHICQCFGYERHANPEVVERINLLVKNAYGPLRNYFHASLKLERKERTEGLLRRGAGPAQTPLARVLASVQVLSQTKRRLQQEKAGLNPLALLQVVARSLKTIASLRQARP